MNEQEPADIPDAMDWLAGASPEMMSALSDRADRVSLPAGHRYIWAEQAAGGLTAIVSGRVDLHLAGVREGRTLIHAFGPGWWLGDLSAVSGEPRSFDHVAAFPSELLRLNRYELGRLCQDHPDAWRCLARMLAINMRLAIDVVEQHRLADPTARVVMCLLRLHRTGGSWGGRLPVTQAELASMADLSRRRTIAALETLEHAGAVRRTYGAVEILDAAVLTSCRW